MQHKSLVVAVAAALGAGGLVAGSPAGAQGLEEIVVTARRTEEILQDAPVSVSAFSERAIEDLGLRDIDDIARFTPGFSNSAYVGRRGDRPVIRGQSNVLAQVQFGVESGTAYFVDGVYWPGSTQAIDMNDIERVEIIKGPQSALYGRNTYSGAINYVTRSPSNEFEGRARASYGRYGETDNSISFSGPIVEDQLFFSVHGRYYEYDGEYRNQLTGERVGWERTKSVSGVLTWEPHDNVSIRFRTAFSKDRDGFPPIFLWDSNQNNCAPGFRSNANYAQWPTQLFGAPVYGENENQYYCGTIPARPDAIQQTPEQVPLEGFERYQWLNSLAGEFDIGGTGYIMRLQGAFRSERDRYGVDSDFIGPDVTFITTQEENVIDDYSVELRIESPQEERLRWIAGVFYYDQDDDQFLITPDNPTRFGLDVNIAQTIDNRALFGLLEYDFTDRLTGTIEARYAEEEKIRVESAAEGGFVGGRTFYSFTPRATLNFELNEDVMLYGILARGNKPGGVNGSDGAGVGTPFYDEETSTNVEIGAKLDWLDGRLRTNFVAYYIDADDVQLTTAIGGFAGGTTSIATNQGSADIWGFEFDMQAAVTDNLTVGATYAWTRPRFKDGCDDFEYVLNSGGFLIPPIDQLTDADRQLCDISGNRLPLTSEHQASLNGRYSQQFTAGYEWFVSGDVTYESSKFVQVHNRAKAGAATLVGLRLGVESERVRVALYGRNLLDEDSVVNATRWFDGRYNDFGQIVPGLGGAANRAPAEVDGQPVDRSFLGPRGFFTTLRQGRTWGIEASLRF